MTGLAELLARDELLLLFVVILSGLALGRLRVRGVGLGLAGVLFAGLGLSAWLTGPGTELRIAPELKEVGLVLFVYAVGLTSAHGFFAAWRHRGLRLNLVVVAALLCGAGVAALGGQLFGLNRGQIAGVFCGALTNTPALGAATDRLTGTALEVQPAIGYSVTYPFGVLGALLLFRGFARFSRERLEAEQIAAASSSGDISSATLKVTSPQVIGRSIGELRIRDDVGVLVSRLKRNSDTIVPSKYSVLQENDLVTVVGSKEAVERSCAYFGEPSDVSLDKHREHVDMRRVLVSRKDCVGCRLDELELDRRFNARVTRIRRADLDFVARDDMRIELGDRLRVVAPSRKLQAVSEFFGDSERALAEVDYVALALGIAGGLLLARVPLPLFGTTLTLGAAGGPLLVALVLGRLSRTGPFVWTMHYEANRVLRDLGLLLFLAGVGVSAGARLPSLVGDEALTMFGVGAAITLLTTAIALALARWWARADVITSLGASSGMQTQPATLEAAYELSGRSDETYVAYALVFPVAMIGKILLAQLLALLAW